MAGLKESIIVFLTGIGLLADTISRAVNKFVQKKKIEQHQADIDIIVNDPADSIMYDFSRKPETPSDTQTNMDSDGKIP